MTDPFATLPAAFAERARQIVAQREADGLNVHFVNERGEQDRFSFATKERADAFRAKIARRAAR